MKYDYIIIGGGIVGLATAYNLLKKKSELKICILEKEDTLAAHQTGHNSGVIHSGIYYKPGSLKAQNCLLGYRMLIDFCNEHKINYDLCGKLIVAVNTNELTELDKLYQRGIDNGLHKNILVGKDEIKNFEPNVSGLRAIHVPYTGIIDYKHVCNKLAELILAMGAGSYTSHKVMQIQQDKNEVLIITEKESFLTKYFINCAGLFSDKIASLNNRNLDTRIIPFRGEYFLLKPEKRNLVKNLIYPVPDPNFPFLGVHFTRMIEGGVKAGPNAIFAFKREGYKMSDVDLIELYESLSWPGFQKVMMKYWKTGIGEFYRSFSKAAFTKALQRLIPDVKKDDLISSEAGVRAQACDKFGGLIDDFKIIEESNAIHVLNAPSPAATSSLSIGKKIADLAINKSNN